MSPEPVPTPDHLEESPPEADLPALVYDGDCAFCQRCADWIAARLPAGVSVMASQEADLAGLRLSPHQAAGAAWWVDTDGRHHRGHRAIAASLRACRGGWSKVGRVLTWPGISLLAAAVYELIARNRHRLGCTNCFKKTQRGGPALS